MTKFILSVMFLVHVACAHRSVAVKSEAEPPAFTQNEVVQHLQRDGEPLIIVHNGGEAALAVQSDNERGFEIVAKPSSSVPNMLFTGGNGSGMFLLEDGQPFWTAVWFSGDQRELRLQTQWGEKGPSVPFDCQAARPSDGIRFCYKR